MRGNLLGEKRLDCVHKPNNGKQRQFKDKLIALVFTYAASLYSRFEAGRRGVGDQGQNGRRDIWTCWVKRKRTCTRWLTRHWRRWGCNMPGGGTDRSAAGCVWLTSGWAAAGAGSGCWRCWWGRWRSRGPSPRAPGTGWVAACRAAAPPRSRAGAPASASCSGRRWCWDRVRVGWRLTAWAAGWWAAQVAAGASA